MSLDVTLTATRPTEVYWANITHNLGKMAEEAGLYQYLWRPEEVGIDYAWQLVDPLTEGLNRLKAEPAHYKQFDASNGWGNYDNLVAFVEKYLQACCDNPDAEIRVSR